MSCVFEVMLFVGSYQVQTGKDNEAAIEGGCREKRGNETTVESKCGLYLHSLLATVQDERSERKAYSRTSATGW